MPMWKMWLFFLYCLSHRTKLAWGQTLSTSYGIFHLCEKVPLRKDWWMSTDQPCALFKSFITEVVEFKHFPSIQKHG